MNSYEPLNSINAGLCFGDRTIPVGRLAVRKGIIYFEYNDEFIRRNLNISPFKLPLERGLKSFDPALFEGLPGVFNDSLPDGWGRLLLDRFLRSKDILPQQISSLDRLAQVGSIGIGALVYEPDWDKMQDNRAINLDKLYDQTQFILNGGSNEVIQELLLLNGSSTGARPKALIGVDENLDNIIYGISHLPDGYEHWIVKFANVLDGKDAGAIEYVYSLMAKDAGVTMTRTHLFSGTSGSGYFATKRFDRTSIRRLHTHTASGLLHSDYRIPALDYKDLINLTEVLTKDVREVEKMFRIAVFNVLAHNRDYHSKNFTFLMNSEGNWQLSPAYDLTFSSGLQGEQSTMIMGEGKHPDISHLIHLGQEAKVGRKLINLIIEQTQQSLSQWEVLAKNQGVSSKNISLIENKLRSILR